MNISISTIAALIILVIFGNGCRGGEAPSVQLNIIIVLTDDQVSSSLRFMPNVDSLIANEGVSFSNFFINNPICCPSRVAIFTGKYHHNHGIETAPRPSSCGQRYIEAGLNRNSMGMRLQDAGYRTIYIG